MKPRAMFVLPEENFRLIYSPEHVSRIQELVDVHLPCQSSEKVRENLSLLNGVELIFTGWGSLEFTNDVLNAAPDLKMIFYGAGSIRGVMTDAAWERGVRITSAWAANAVPVVEFALAHILLCLKKAYQHAAEYREKRQWVRLPVAGGYHSTVGLISLGMIGRLLAEKLKSFEVHVIAYDPYVSQEEAKRLNVEMVSLEEIFQRSDVVSLHTPLLETTRGMIRGEHFSRMKEGAAFINTSRGAVVREDEMIAVLRQRPDLFAVLDVTWPEPAAPDSPLFTLPNVFLSPHIAGSMGAECQRMGQLMVEELERYLEGRPLAYEITRERAALLA